MARHGFVCLVQGVPDFEGAMDKGGAPAGDEINCYSDISQSLRV